MVAQSLRASVQTLSVKPGVYLLKDARGRVLYVGKAKSLRKRVLQYFDPARLPPAKREMMGHVHQVDTVVTQTEPEALALEATLIPQHEPPYNVRLVDDSSYLYVKITNEPYPKVMLTRRVLPDDAWYRGPFPSTRSIRQTLKEARKLFPWCAYPNPEAPHPRPCFAYHIGLCPGICVRALSLEDYQQNIERLKRFLDGDTKETLQSLRERMDALSRAQRYEQAGRVRDAIRAIEQTMTPQNVVTPRRESADVLGIARRGTHAAAAVLQVRHGRVIGTQIFPLLHPLDEPTPVVLRGFLLQYYRHARGEVPAIVLPPGIHDAQAIAAWLRTQQGTRSALVTARRGWKRTLMTLATTNAEEALTTSLTELTSPANLKKALDDLAGALHLPSPLTRIEAYDISNIQGTLATASMVVFVQGKPAPSEYRKFQIVSRDTPNDVGMMEEVLRRRFKHHGSRQGRGRWPLPDLILLDGGKGQLSAGRRILEELELECPIAALAKREEELSLPGKAEPLRLPRTSPALYLIQRLRDEAHRFTLGYHRLLRKKRMTRSLLEEIPGVGDATRKKLLRAFGSLAAITAASRKDLERVLGSRKQGETIHAFLAAARTTHR
jgi:excinuclease ABC subunit C